MGLLHYGGDRRSERVIANAQQQKRIQDERERAGIIMKTSHHNKIEIKSSSLHSHPCTNYAVCAINSIL